MLVTTSISPRGEYGMVGRSMFLCLAAIFAAPWCASAAPVSLLVSAPRAVHPGWSQTAVVHAYSGTCSNGCTYTGTLALVDGGGAEVARKTFSLEAGDDYAAEVRVAVPAGLKASTSGMEWVASVGSGGDEAKARAPATVGRSGHPLLVETDKPVYKPGQTVRLRVVSLDRDLKPSPSSELQVTVLCPSGNKVRRWTDVATDSKGLAELELETTGETMLGEWSIEAMTPMATTVSRFSVEDYVLPRFGVELESEVPYVTSGEARVKGRVRATYTYGKGVDGVVTVQAYQRQGGWYYEEPAGGIVNMGMPEGDAVMAKMAGDEAQYNQRPVYAMLAEEVQIPLLDGEAEFDLGTLGSAFSLWGSNLVLKAAVTESATGVRLTGTSEVVVARCAQSVMVLHRESANVFAPGSDSTTAVRVKVTAADGSPKVGVRVFACGIEAYRVDYTFDKWSSGVTCDYGTSPTSPTWNADDGIMSETDSAGIALLRLPSPPREYSSCCNSQSVGTYDGNCCFQSLNAVVRIHGDTDTDCNWGSYVSIPRLSTSISATLAVEATGPLKEGSGWTNVRAKGSNPSEAAGSPFRYVLLSRGDVFGSGSATVDGDGVISGLPKVTKGMAPEVSVLMYYATSSGDLVAGAARVPVERGSNTGRDLKAAFSSSEVLPGDPVDIILSSGLGSNGADGTVAWVTTVDSSVALLAGTSQLTLAGVDTSLASLTEPPPQTLLSGCNNARNQAADVGIAMADSAFDYDATGCSYDEGVDMMFAGAMDDGAEAEMAGMAESADASAAKTGASEGAAQGTALAQPTRTRKFFPETWVWESVPLSTLSGGSGGAISTIAPDTITSWRLDAFALSPTHGLHVAPSSDTLRVFKPFFGEMKLPNSAVRGESLEVVCSVFNYIEGSGSTSVTLTLSAPGGSLSVQGDTSKVVVVPEGGASSASFLIIASALGMQSLKLTVQSASDADAVERTILVVPEGVPRVDVTNFFVDLDGSGEFLASLSTELPSEAIEGSGSSRLAVVGDLLGPALDNLDRLLPIPTGCGEQNMIGLAPNVYVHSYLTASGKGNPDILARAKSNVERGYQRELTYRHSDGSFSAFGASDGAGSLWLTAFVLRCFAEARAVSFVDPNILDEAAAFVASTQAQDGSFSESGDVIHSEMMGGTAAGTSLAAFVVMALAESGREASALEKAVRYLENAAADSALRKDPYDLALVAYALSKAKSSMAADAISRLMALAEVDAPSGTMHWSGRSSGSSGSLDVEATAYGLLALCEAGKAGEAYGAAAWLLKERNAFGGYHSTQDTVVGLQALARYATLVSTSSGSVSLSMSAGDSGEELDVAAVEVSSTTRDLMQVRSMPLDRVISLVGSGSGVALASLVVEYNVPNPSDDPAYAMEVEWYDVPDGRADLLTDLPPSEVVPYGVADCEEQGGCVVRADAAVLITVQDTSSPMESEGSGMAVLDLGLFTGYVPVDPALAALKSGQGVISMSFLSEKRDRRRKLASGSAIFGTPFSSARTGPEFVTRPGEMQPADAEPSRCMSESNTMRVKRTETGDRRLTLYLSMVPTVPTTLVVLLRRDHGVSSLQPASTHLYSYYMQEKGARVLSPVGPEGGKSLDDVVWTDSKKSSGGATICTPPWAALHFALAVALCAP